MAQKVLTMNEGKIDCTLFLVPFTVIYLSLWMNVTVLAAPPVSKFNDDRRIPLSEELFDPSNEWREPVEPKNKWRTDEPLTKKNKKGSRFEDKRFKPKYYDPEKEGNTWDPYSSDSKPNTKPATIFRFQF
ncbi:MAG: hypothetical protein ACI9UO_001768 [Nitrospinales bacterium]|jgi:hypothetical protein